MAMTMSKEQKNRTQTLSLSGHEVRGALRDSLMSKSQNLRILITDDNYLWTLWADSYEYSLVSLVFLDNLKLMRFDIKSDKPWYFAAIFIYPIIVTTINHNHHL